MSLINEYSGMLKDTSSSKPVTEEQPVIKEQPVVKEQPITEQMSSLDIPKKEEISLQDTISGSEEQDVLMGGEGKKTDVLTGKSLKINMGTFDKYFQRLQSDFAKTLDEKKRSDFGQGNWPTIESEEKKKKEEGIRRDEEGVPSSHELGSATNQPTDKDSGFIDFLDKVIPFRETRKYAAKQIKSVSSLPQAVSRAGVTVGDLVLTVFENIPDAFGYLRVGTRSIKDLNIKDPNKAYIIGGVRPNILLEGFNAMIGTPLFWAEPSKLPSAQNPDIKQDPEVSPTLLKSFYGPNLFAEFYHQAFVDYTYEVKGLKDADYLNKYFIPSIAFGMFAKGRKAAANSEYGRAILNFLDVPENEDTAFLKGVTFGTEALMLGPVRMYSLATKKAVDGTKKYLYPYLEKGADIYKIAGSRKTAQARLNNLKELYGKGPWAKPTETLKDILYTQGQMALGGGGAYAAAEMFLEDTEYKDASLLFGLAGMMSGGEWGYVGKFPVIGISPNKIGRASTRTLNFLLYSMLAGTAKAEKGLVSMLGGNLQKHSVSFERAHVNSYLRAMGYKGSEIKDIEQKVRKNVQDLIDEYGTEEGKRLAIQRGFMREDGTIDINLSKQPYTEVRASELKLWRQMIDELNNIKDPALKADLQAAAERTSNLFNKLSSDMAGLPDQVYEKIQMTLGQALQLHTIKAYQSSLLSKVHLDSFGYFKKGQIISQMERVQRIMDKQVEAIRVQLTSLVPKKDADDVTKAIFSKLNNSVKQEISNREKFYNKLKELKGKFSKNIEQETNAFLSGASKLMRIRVADNALTQQQRYNAYNIFNGKKVKKEDGSEGNFEDYPYRGYGQVPEEFSKVSRKGIIPSRIEESSKRYEELFQTAEKNDYFINIGKLEDRTFDTFKDDMFIYKIREVVGNKIPNISDFTIISVARRRGLNRKRKEFDDAEEYENFLDEIVMDNPQMVQPKFLEADFEEANRAIRIKKYEDVILNHKERIEEIPTLLSVREWHALRSKALKEERRIYNTNSEPDMQRYNALKFARKNLEDTFQKINDESFVRKNADGSTSFIKEKKEVFEKLQKQFKYANDYHRNNVAIFNQGKLLEMFSKRGGQDKYLPEEYMSLFFSGKDNLAFGRKQFDNLFAKRDTQGNIVLRQDGSIVHTDEGLELLYDGLGLALSKGTITSNGREIIESYAEVLGKDRTEFFIKLEQQKIRLLQHEKLMTPNNKEFVKTFEKKLETILDDNIDEATKITIERLQQSIGKLSTLKTGDLPSYARSYWKDTDIAATDELIAKVLFDNVIGVRYALDPKIKKELLEKNVDEIKFRKDANVTAQNKKELYDNVEELLPPANVKAQDDPLRIIMDYFGDDKDFVDNLKSVLMRDLLRKSVKQKAEISPLNMAKETKQNFLSRLTTSPEDAYSRTSGQFSLSKEFDIVAMEKFFKDRQRVMSILYTGDEGIRHLNTLGELFDLAKLTATSKSLVNIQGIAAPYSMQMGIGRLYNVMKGVLSPRYLALEAGAIQTRVKTQQALTEMFLSPTAAEVIVDGFVRFNKEFKPKILTATLGKMLGIDLNEKEKSLIIKAAIESRNYVQAVTQPQSEVFREINIKQSDETQIPTIEGRSIPTNQEKNLSDFNFSPVN